MRDPDFEMVGAPIGVRKGAGAGTVGVGVEGEATGDPYGGTSVARGAARTRDPVAGVSVGALRAGVRVLCILLSCYSPAFFTSSKRLHVRCESKEAEKFQKDRNSVTNEYQFLIVLWVLPERQDR